VLGEDLGEDGEAIERADWFAEPPAELFDRELASQLIARVR
jgi:hypothetical protein